MFRMLKFVRKKSVFLMILVLSGTISGCGLKGPLYQTPEKLPVNQSTTDRNADTHVNQVPK